jgi:hypothetical protein
MIYTESREPTLDLRDEAVLYAEGLLLTLVGIDTGVEVKPAALMLQVVHELVDGDVVFGGIGQIGPDIDDIMILVQPIDRAGDVILASPMTEPTLGFELNFGQGVGDRIARQSRCRYPTCRSPVVVHEKTMSAMSIETSSGSTTFDPLAPYA